MVVVAREENSRKNGGKQNRIVDRVQCYMYCMEKGSSAVPTNAGAFIVFLFVRFALGVSLSESVTVLHAGLCLYSVSWVYRRAECRSDPSPTMSVMLCVFNLEQTQMAFFLSGVVAPPCGEDPCVAQEVCRHMSYCEWLCVCQLSTQVNGFMPLFPWFVMFGNKLPSEIFCGL